jgi:hypothetical protein
VVKVEAAVALTALPLAVAAAMVVSPAEVAAVAVPEHQRAVLAGLVVLA